MAIEKTTRTRSIHIWGVNPTRRPLIQRDIDILQSYPGDFIVSITVETDREDIIFHFTPKAPSIQFHLKTVDKLRVAHIPIRIAIAPIFLVPFSLPRN